MRTSKVLVLELTTFGVVVGRSGKVCWEDDNETDNESLSCVGEG